MFEHHRKSPWFAEKYDPSPDLESLRMRVRKEGWKGRQAAFLYDLEQGKFDPDLNEPDDPEPSSPDKETEGTNVDSATVTTGAPADMKPGDYDNAFNVEGDDDDPSRVDANSKASSDKKPVNRSDEVSVPPEGNQVMIRTIPPDIGRVKLEEVRLSTPGLFKV